VITQDDIRRQRDAILAIGRRHGAHDVRVFGSVARNEAAERSDLDLIVRFDSARTLLDHAGLIANLADLLGIKVDVVDADGMRPRFRAVVEREASPR
jgi:hypothetical protein